MFNRAVSSSSGRRGNPWRDDQLKHALQTQAAFEAHKTDGGKALIRSDTYLALETPGKKNACGFTAAMERYAKEDWRPTTCCCGKTMITYADGTPTDRLCQHCGDYGADH